MLKYLLPSSRRCRGNASQANIPSKEKALCGWQVCKRTADRVVMSGPRVASEVDSYKNYVDSKKSKPRLCESAKEK